MPDSRWKLVSIRTLRGEGDVAQKLGELIDMISIHALREEGDGGIIYMHDEYTIFLSTPSARRATPLEPAVLQLPLISIHALREEGDSKNRDKISIFL